MQDRVLIIGAGPAGLCLALDLARRGVRVEVVEKQAEEALQAPAFDGREVALKQGSIRHLKAIGVWQHIADQDQSPLYRAQIMDGADAGFVVSGDDFNGAELGRFVSNCHIRAAAWKAVNLEARITVHTGVAVQAVATDAYKAVATLEDGRTLQADLLVAADSRFSNIRRALGIATYMHDFGRTMFLCRIKHTQSNTLAWEWFGREHGRALLPLGERVSSAVITVPDREARAMLDMRDDALAQNLAARYEGRLGDIEIASTRHAYPLVGTWAHRFAGERFALVGDAAVGMHPVTAHGFNLGLTSVEHLAHTTEQALRRYHDVGNRRMLARYERRHRGSALIMFAGTQTVARLFTDNRRRVKPIRRVIMQTGRALPLVSRALAAGLVDDHPHPVSPWQHLRRGIETCRPRTRNYPYNA